MSRRRWMIAAVALAVGLTSCSSRGDLEIDNESPAAVTVLTGDQKVEIDAWGGAEILDYGCTPGDVTVRFSSSPAVVVPGPVCPEQTIVVRDGTVEVRSGTESTP